MLKQVALVLAVIGWLAVPTWAQTWTCSPPLGQVPEGQTAACTTTFDSMKYSDGPHTLSVTVTDAAGKTATATVNITIDNTPPELLVVSPQPNQVVSRTFSVSGTVMDATSGVSLVTLLINGSPVRVTLGSPNFYGFAQWTSDIVTTKGGWATISATASDQAGNRSMKTFRVRTRN